MSAQRVVREGGGPGSEKADAPLKVDTEGSLRLPVSLRVEEWGRDGGLVLGTQEWGACWEGSIADAPKFRWQGVPATRGGHGIGKGGPCPYSTGLDVEAQGPQPLSYGLRGRHLERTAASSSSAGSVTVSEVHSHLGRRAGVLHSPGAESAGLLQTLCCGGPCGPLAWPGGLLDAVPFAEQCRAQASDAWLTCSSTSVYLYLYL